MYSYSKRFYRPTGWLVYKRNTQVSIHSISYKLSYTSATVIPLSMALNVGLTNTFAGMQHSWATILLPGFKACSYSAAPLCSGCGSFPFLESSCRKTVLGICNLALSRGWPEIPPTDPRSYLPRISDRFRTIGSSHDKRKIAAVSVQSFRCICINHCRGTVSGARYLVIDEMDSFDTW